jgi:hypothetical protein
MQFVVALLCAIALWHAEQACAADDFSNGAAPVIPTEWLIKKITVEEAEAERPGLRDERIKRFPEAAKPFGFQNPAWESLKAEMKPGDEIWTFASPAEDWNNHAGRAGVALVRNGSAIKVLVTIMN